MFRNDKNSEFDYICFEYMIHKNKTLLYVYSNCKSFYNVKFDNEIDKKFGTTFKYCGKDLNKFVLKPQKDVYLHYQSSKTFMGPKIWEYYNIWYKKSKSMQKMKNVGDSHDLYVQSDTLLLFIFLKFSWNLL